jgi:cytoskeletal protein CcmA (bactofilin family)
MKKTSFILILFCLFLAPLATHAYVVKTGPSVYVAADQTIEGNLYVGGQSITIDGIINGDLICGTQVLTINGQVLGDVICGAKNININGTVNGSVRVAGETIVLNSRVERNVMTFGSNVSLGTNAVVNGEMLVAAAFSDIRGQIAGDLHGVAANLDLAGSIGGNVRLRLNENQKTDAKSLIVEKTAQVNGDINYTAGTAGTVIEGAKIGGQINYSAPVKKQSLNWGEVHAWTRLFSIFSALVVGLVLISLWGEQLKEIAKNFPKNIGPSLGWGAIITFLTPIVSFVLILTIIGAPLALIFFALWLIALYLSKIIVGIAIGLWLMKKIKSDKKTSLMLPMIIGIILTWLIYSIPVFGWILCLMAVWLGLGGLFLYWKEEIK